MISYKDIALTIMHDLKQIMLEVGLLEKRGRDNDQKLASFTLDSISSDLHFLAKKVDDLRGKLR